MARCRALRRSSGLLLMLRAAAALHINAFVHYPEVNSAFDQCGFTFRIASSKSDPAEAPALRRVDVNLFEGSLFLPDTNLFTKVTLSIVVDFATTNSKGCQVACPHLGPQGALVMNGPFLRSGPLTPENKVHFYPSFCALEWNTTYVHFFSPAIGRQVQIKARIPGEYAENSLPRPTGMIPPVIFRFNSEWYWPYNDRDFNTWHDLMSNGEMESFVVGEVYIDGVEWTEWFNQPIYTTENLSLACSRCDAETQFICDSWQTSGYFTYLGGNHSFGNALGFFDDLYDLGLPRVLEPLPNRTDNATLRVGTWGYCIGGLAAWNSVRYRPERFNIAYIGSPAMDFNCGDPLRDAVNFVDPASVEVRPRIFLDSGAAEGVLMNRQTLMLFRILEAKGLVQGRDIFYDRAEFGTHQGRSLLRRAHKGLIALFGQGATGREAYYRASDQGTIMQQPINLAMGSQPYAFVVIFLRSYYQLIIGCFAAAVMFFVGRRSARVPYRGLGEEKNPLLW